MGKILVILGIAMMGLGIYGLASGFLAPAAAIPNVTGTLDASQYCRDGETLVEESGRSSYTPGLGYGSTVQYYCEDGDGSRRDITAEFNENLVSDVTGIFSSLTSAFSFDMKHVALLGGGLVLIVIGMIVGLRRSLSPVIPLQTSTIGGQAVNTSGRVVRVNGQDVVTTPEVARYIQQAQAMSQFADVGAAVSVGTQASADTDLAGKLKQLEEARQAGLISQAEYDRLRQQILDQMT